MHLCHLGPSGHKLGCFALNCENQGEIFQLKNFTCWRHGHPRRAMLRPSQSDSWKSSLAWVICVKIALICCKAYLAASRPQAASLLTAFPRRSFWCFLNLKGCSFSFFFAIFQKLDGEMLKGFLRVEEPGSSALLSLSISSWADTSSTLSLFVTSSTPSLAEGLLFRRSWTVPFNLNLFQDPVQGSSLIRWGGVDLSSSVSRPPEY